MIAALTRPVVFLQTMIPARPRHWEGAPYHLIANPNLSEAIAGIRPTFGILALALKAPGWRIPAEGYTAFSVPTRPNTLSHGWLGADNNPVGRHRAVFGSQLLQCRFYIRANSLDALMGQSPMPGQQLRADSPVRLGSGPCCRIKRKSGPMQITAQAVYPKVKPADY